MEELHTLLERAETKKPYLLVGASFGGHVVRLYATRYPDEVAGVVLLDARHEDVDAQMPPSWARQAAAGKGMYRLLLLAARLRVLALLGKLMGAQATPPVVEKLPPQIQPVYLAVGFQPKYFQSNLDELAAASESDAQLRAAGELGQLPLTVIRHGLPDLFAGMPPAQAQRAEQTWQALQLELAQLSASGRLLVAEGSGHAIQIDQPGLVVGAIRQLVEAIRGASSS